MKFCTHCGKAIADEAVICLNCGCKPSKVTPFVSPQAMAPAPETIAEGTESPLATWAKICGIVSFFIGWWALGITAIVLACMSKEDTHGVMCSSAKVGYVCGIISTVLSLVIFIILIAVLVSL